MFQCKNENLRVEAIHRSPAKSEYRARRQFSSHSLSRKKTKPGKWPQRRKSLLKKMIWLARARNRGRNPEEGIVIDSGLYEAEYKKLV